jgi:hypothetical protein
MLRNHGPDDACNNMYPLKIKKTVSFLSSSENTAALLHGNPVCARIHHKRCTSYNNKGKTLHKTYCV